MNHVLGIESVGPGSFDVFTRFNTFAGLVASRNDGTFRVYFDSNCARGSAKKFYSVNDCLAYLANRRVTKGWRI